MASLSSAAPRPSISHSQIHRQELTAAAQAGREGLERAARGLSLKQQRSTRETKSFDYVARTMIAGGVAGIT
ncbi:hypothetical protein BGX34_000339, partial [Mortierella sp. NVP85]